MCVKLALLFPLGLLEPRRFSACQRPGTLPLARTENLTLSELIVKNGKCCRKHRLLTILYPQEAMSVLPEKLALRRLLHNYVCRLDEKIVELMSTETTGQTVPVPCRFCDDQIILWNDRQHVFSPNTYALLKQFFDAPNRTLSKEDVRQDVLGDDEAREGTVRQCISTARKELRRTRFPYRIETITRKGYRLITEEN